MAHALEAVTSFTDRRKGQRFAMSAAAVLSSPNDGRKYPATTVNISGGGVLLRTESSHPFRAGDVVVCEIAPGDLPNQPFFSWALGTVVRAGSNNAAIQLKSGIFAND